MSKLIVQFALALLTTAIAVPAADARPPTEQEAQAKLRQTSYVRGGYFFGAEGFYSLERSPEILGGELAGSGGFRLRVGNRHNRWFATELQGMYVNNFVGANQRFLAWGMAVNERFYFSKSRFQPYITAGPGFLQIRADLEPGSPPQVLVSRTPGFAAHFGAGIEIYMTETFLATLDASYYLTVGNISGYDFMTFGFGLQWF